MKKLSQPSRYALTLLLITFALLPGTGLRAADSVDLLPVKNWAQDALNTGTGAETDQEAFKLGSANLEEKSAVATDPLAGREWTPLTEIDPVLDKEEKALIHEALEVARIQANLHFIVITAKAGNVQEYADIALALMSGPLSAKDGGVLVVTDAPGVQLTAYTKLLETRLGSGYLKKLDVEAFRASEAALGSGERALTMVRAVLTPLTQAVRSTMPDTGKRRQPGNKPVLTHSAMAGGIEPTTPNPPVPTAANPPVPTAAPAAPAVVTERTKVLALGGLGVSAALFLLLVGKFLAGRRGRRKARVPAFAGQSTLTAQSRGATPY